MCLLERGNVNFNLIAPDGRPALISSSGGKKDNIKCLMSIKSVSFKAIEESLK